MTRLTRPSDSASGRAELAGRAQQIHRRRQADQARQQPAHAVLGDQAALGERRREDGRFGGEPQIGIERDDEAQAGGRAVDRRDDEFRDRREVGVVHPELGQGAAPLQCLVRPWSSDRRCRRPRRWPAGRPCRHRHRSRGRAPVRMIARTSGSAPAVCMASLRSKCIWRVHAFNFSGRLSAMVQIRSETVVQNRLVCHPGAPSCAILWSA